MHPIRLHSRIVSASCPKGAVPDPHTCEAGTSNAGIGDQFAEDEIERALTHPRSRPGPPAGHEPAAALTRMELPLRAAALGLTRTALVGTPIGTTRPAGPRHWSGWSEERDAGWRSEGWTGSMPVGPAAVQTIRAGRAKFRSSPPSRLVRVRHAVLRQLGLPLRGVRALTSSELNTMGRAGRPNLMHYAIGDSA